MGEDEQARCNSSCLRKYNAFKDIPWRVYCKKACGNDGESWDECIESCRGLCHKHPIYKGDKFEWTSALDRSPGNVYQCRRCDKACLRGCAAKFLIAEDVLNAAIPAKVPRPLWLRPRAGSPYDPSSLWTSA